jgi:DNA-binding MarR family transcriptional regulator
MNQNKFPGLESMEENEIKTLARYIFSTGRVIQENVIRIQACCLAEEGKKVGFNELSMTQLHAVKTTVREGEVTISRLAELLGVSAPSASTMVDRLVEKSILIRERNKQDRRKVVVQVSPEAVKDIERVEAAILKKFEDIVRKIGPETARKWCEVLGKVKEVIDLK